MTMSDTSAPAEAPPPAAAPVAPPAPTTSVLTAPPAVSAVSASETPASPVAPPALSGAFSALDPDTQAWLATKGWTGDADVPKLAASYRQLEKAQGRSIALPADENDTEGLSKVWDKLGRPASPDGYELDLGEGVDPALATGTKDFFHKQGFTAKQAKAAIEYQQALVLDQETKFQAEDTARMAELKKEWGGQFDQKLETARAAMKAAQFTEDQINTLRRAMTDAELVRKFEFFGRNYVEAQPLGAAGPDDGQRLAPGFRSMSPAQAKATLDEWYQDDKKIALRTSKIKEVREKAEAEVSELTKLAENAKLR